MCHCRGGEEACAVLFRLFLDAFVCVCLSVCLRVPCSCSCLALFDAARCDWLPFGRIIRSSYYFQRIVWPPLGLLLLPLPVDHTVGGEKSFVRHTRWDGGKTTHQEGGEGLVVNNAYHRRRGGGEGTRAV